MVRFPSPETVGLKTVSLALLLTNLHKQDWPYVAVGAVISILDLNLNPKTQALSVLCFSRVRRVKLRFQF